MCVDYCTASDRVCEWKRMCVQRSCDEPRSGLGTERPVRGRYGMKGVLNLESGMEVGGYVGSWVVTDKVHLGAYSIRFPLLRILHFPCGRAREYCRLGMLFVGDTRQIR